MRHTLEVAADPGESVGYRLTQCWVCGFLRGAPQVGVGWDLLGIDFVHHALEAKVRLWMVGSYSLEGLSVVRTRLGS